MSERPEGDDGTEEPRRGFRVSMGTKISGLAFLAMLVLTIVFMVMENFKTP